MLDLSGRTALVTGAAKRLGAAMVRALAEEGVRVVLHYRSAREEAEELAESLRHGGATVWTAQAALGAAGAAEALFAEAEALSGGIDMVVNSASIFPKGTLHDLDEARLLENLQVNTLAPFALARCLAGTGRSGCVLNLLDTRIADYDREHVPYHLSKRALYSLTRMMAEEFAPRLRVNAVAPGLVLPPPGEDEAYLARLAHTNPLARHGGAEDVAAAAVFLLKSDFITGQVVFVDGGRHLRGSMYAY